MPIITVAHSPWKQITRALLVAADRARGALSEFIGQARLVQNPELVMGPLTRREAVLSSRIEGCWGSR